MKEFDFIDKQMPYAENEQYLDQLLDTCTENAIKQVAQKSNRSILHRVQPLHWAIATVAAIALLLVVGITQFKSEPTLVAETEQVESPMDQFLNSISDEEAQLLACYEIEEIPEF